MTTTTTDTKTIARIYVSIERVLDGTTGWSHIERVYASFWDENHNCLRDTSYGLTIKNDSEVFEAVQGSLDAMLEEGFESLNNPEVAVSHIVRTTIEGNYWNTIGRHV